MAISKIPCGGFSYDDSEITFENGVIHPIGGGGSGDIFTVKFMENEDGEPISDKTWQQVKDVLSNNKLVVGYMSDGNSFLSPFIENSFSPHEPIFFISERTYIVHNGVQFYTTTFILKEDNTVEYEEQNAFIPITQQ